MSNKMKLGQTMKLGSQAERSDEATWLNIAIHNGEYVLWNEAEDAEIREVLLLSPDEPLPGIKVRRWGHPAKNAYWRDALKKYRRLGATLPAELEQKISRGAVAHAILVDWRYLAMPDGSVQAYSPEVGMQAFVEDPDFYDAVVKASMTEDHFRAQTLKEGSELLGEA